MPDDPAAAPDAPKGGRRNFQSEGAGTGNGPDQGLPLPGPDTRSPNWLDFLSLGTACALCIIIGGGLGYLGDSWLGIAPWLTFVGLAFGITSAVMLAVVRLRQYL